MSDAPHGATTSRILDRVSKDARGLVERLQRLQDIGSALSSETDLGRLLSMILKESRALTNADSGTVYIREDDVTFHPEATARDPITTRTPKLAMKVGQNDSLDMPFKEIKLAFDPKTIAGFVATSGDLLNIPDVYNLPAKVSFSYNKAFDQKSGYRCKSMLVLPMRNRHNEIIGVIQLINKKRSASTKLATPDDVEKHVDIFDLYDEELALSLASQAAVCIEKAKLYEDIEKMFDGLVQSFTLALEKRNRTTYGHCQRVAQYALAIAEAVNSVPERFGGVFFTPNQMKELRFAALLHDIGKIAVPEAVLDKQNKLTAAELTTVEYRFHYWRQRLLADGKKDEVALVEKQLALVQKVNIPRPISAEDAKALDEIKASSFIDFDGREKPLLTDYEHENLAIKYGNLTGRERKQIEQHIVDTWDMLRRVPWPREVSMVPNIAACHHEKIDGSGYPWGFKVADIPFGGKILAIVDIFEALTAKDRPYKPAIPVDRAIQIVEDEVKKGKLDAALWELFKERKAYNLFVKETGFVDRPAEPQVPTPK